MPQRYIAFAPQESSWNLAGNAALLRFRSRTYRNMCIAISARWISARGKRCSILRQARGMARRCWRAIEPHRWSGAESEIKWSNGPHRTMATTGCGCSKAISAGPSPCPMPASMWRFALHLDPHDSFLSYLVRVMRLDATLVICASGKALHSPCVSNPFHAKELTRDEFHTLLSRQFANVDLYHQEFLAESVITVETPPRADRSGRAALFPSARVS